MTEITQDSREVESEQIYSQRPQAKNIEWIGAGDANDIALVDNTEIFRFPRNNLGRQQLAYEFELLPKLQDGATLNLPKPIYIGSDNSFGIVSYVSGEVLRDETIRESFDTDDQVALGKSLAIFMKELNASISTEDVKNAQRLRPDWESWDEWYDKMLETATKNDSQFLTRYKDTLSQAKRLLPNGFDRGDIVIHDDLHALNMIFTEDRKLTGIIDFGDLNTGDIHRELRPIYRMGPKVIESLIVELDGQFGSINIEAIRGWAILHEVAVLIEREDKGSLDSRRAKYATSLLKLWLGENWAEL